MWSNLPNITQFVSCWHWLGSRSPGASPRLFHHTLLLSLNKPNQSYSRESHRLAEGTLEVSSSSSFLRLRHLWLREGEWPAQCGSRIRIQVFHRWISLFLYNFLIASRLCQKQGAILSFLLSVFFTEKSVSIQLVTNKIAIFIFIVHSCSS